ncbi:MAG: DJ-1/PfpI family protein [Candidatus Omnitrophica bacterium]|nr:DJ-1/PfpI family protein [Candidatus Omnitrophota bacterium]
MSKKAIIVLAEGFEEIEAVTCIDILRRAGIDITVVGLSDIEVSPSTSLRIDGEQSRAIQGAHGISIIVDKNLGDIAPDYDAIIFPGGMPGAKNLADSKKVKTLIQKMHAEGKLIAAICAAPAVVLAPTGILKDKSATCYPGMQENLGSDTSYKEDDVVVDENIITSRGPATAISFSLKIAEKLVGKETADNIKKKTLAI